jgi:hypothetical protein
VLIVARIVCIACLPTTGALASVGQRLELWEVLVGRVDIEVLLAAVGRLLDET